MKNNFNFDTKLTAYISQINVYFILVLILCLSVILRFYHIDYQSIWLDEICSIIEANPETQWKDLEGTIMVSDPHPPLYFAIMKVLFQIFGYTSFVARTFSAVVGVLGVYAMYLLGKAIGTYKTGLLAAFLLAINSFHIYYSQEVRMYALLLLFTILSFYRLVLFLKNSTYKNALLYGFLTGLMLLTQFFGLFVLASQLFLLLIVLIRKEKSIRMTYFKQLIVSGVIMIVSFLPALTIFIATTKKKYAAIQPTTIDTILLIFKDFVQHSSILLFIYSLVLLFVIYYLIKNWKDEKNKMEIYLLIFLWIIITLAIPIIRSYLVTPMIVSRYFITILPAFILLIAIGILKIRKSILQVLFLIFITICTLYELFIAQDYYNKIAKTQFREISEYIKKENKDNDQVVSNLSWYLTYFFNKNQSTVVVDAKLEDYIKSMMENPNKIRPFWYFGAFGNYFRITPDEQAFLDENFILIHSLDQFDSWTKHYIPKNEKNLKMNKIPSEGITLSNINDANWNGGVSKLNNILLLDYEEKTFEKLNKSSFLVTNKGDKLYIEKVERIANYIHLHVDKVVTNYVEEIKYPTIIEIL